MLPRPDRLLSLQLGTVLDDYLNEVTRFQVTLPG